MTAGYVAECAGNVRPDTYTEGALNPIFPRPLYQKYVLPEIFKIFHVRDAHVRKVLLTYFDEYVSLFDKSTIASVLLPQVS